MSINDPKYPSFGALKAQNLDQINVKFICQLCELILVDPWQLLCCGTLLCKWCLKKGIPDREPFVCPYCQTKKTKKEALPDRAVHREIQLIPINCYSCSWNGSYENYLNHLQELHACFQCMECHERFFTINSCEEHRQELCDYRSEPCGLPGCGDSIKWHEMNAHYVTDQHQQILNYIIIEYVSPHRDRLKMRNLAEQTRKEWTDMQESITIAFSVYEILVSYYTPLTTEISEMRRNLDRNIPVIDELKKHEDDLDKSVKKLLQTQEHTQIELDKMKRMKEEDDDILVLDNSSCTTLRFTFPEDPSFSLTSSKFKTSQYGYTFALRVCSTTNVLGQEYLSLFLTLCKGDFDNLLPYPFPYNIHLALWDQSYQRKHIVHVFTSDPNSSSFNRPTTEQNDEIGIPHFCLLGHLTNTQSIYVNDGIFFIRMFVDFIKTGKDPFEVTNNLDHLSTMSE